MPMPNLTHVVLGEPHIRVPALFHHVLHIAVMITEKKMGYFNTGGHVTTVTDLLSSWDWPTF
jgi:hypothetical protein